jgi:L-ascorbate metabolism protein UlaG (beta-lactamase superfamily)
MKKKLVRVMPHKNSSRFYNDGETQQKGFLLDAFCMFLGSLVYRFRDSFKGSWVDKNEPIERSKGLAITWIGHSTFLIQVGGVNILTDPVFGNIFWFFSRVLPPGISLSKLPPIDVILISHNHHDHMECESLLELKKNREPQVLVPLGNKSWFCDCNFKQVTELNWWEQKEVLLSDDHSMNLRITFLPAKHWSQRGIFDKNRSLWGSWMIECNGHTIYFAGDSTYSKHFTLIAQEFPRTDVALLPIGPCEPRSWLKHTHMDSQEAGQAFLDLNAKHFIPMHWGTFHFGAEPFDLPIIRLTTWWQSNTNRLSTKIIHLPKVGQRICF